MTNKILIMKKRLTNLLRGIAMSVTAASVMLATCGLPLSAVTLTAMAAEESAAGDRPGQTASAVSQKELQEEPQGETQDEPEPEPEDPEVIERRREHIQSNDIAGWPEGPAVSAEAAILMDAGTGTILYAKNIHEQLYPASTTKILTCLLAMENGRLSDEVRFSEKAVLSLPSGSSNIGIDPGEYMSLEQALYGILVGSANEVSNAVGEKIGGSLDGFTEMMNKRAAELGCTDSHFANTNGLPNTDHYTSAHDLAVIARAFFDNPTLSRISGTPTYHFARTAGQKDDFTIRNKHKLVNGDIPYSGIVGGKTGYTDLARETLVTCAERDGLKLICVVLKEESPSQFTDTVTLFDFGFNNFRAVNVSSSEKRLLPSQVPFGDSLADIFGNAAPPLYYDKTSTILLPVTTTMEDTETRITYETEAPVFAEIEYSWHGVVLGSARILTAEYGPENTPSSDGLERLWKGSAPDVVAIDLFAVVPVVYGIASALCLIFFGAALIRAFHFAFPVRIYKKNAEKRRRREKLHLE